MRTFATRVLGPRPLFVVLAALALAMAPAARAAVLSYTCNINGLVESPPNASPGVGIGTVDIDDVALTMHVHAVFSGLLGNTTASHIHCATAAPGTGTAGVATTTPSFAGFPLGVTAGTFDNTLDMTLASSYNPSFVTAHTDINGARAFLFLSIANGTAYLNIHTTFLPGGEIRGFLVPANPSATTQGTWGGLKALYR